MKKRILFAILSALLLLATLLGFASCSFGPVQIVKEVKLPAGYVVAYQSILTDGETGLPTTWLYGVDSEGNIRYSDNVVNTYGMITNYVFLKEEDGTFREFTNEGFWDEKNPDLYLTEGLIEMKLSDKLLSMNQRIYRAATPFGGIAKKVQNDNVTIAGLECESYTVTTTTQKSGANYKEKDVYKIAVHKDTGVCMSLEYVSTQRVNIDSEPTPIGSGYVCTELTLNPASFKTIVGES